MDSETAAAYLGVKPATLYTYVSRGWIRVAAASDGRRRRYRWLDLERLNQRRRARRGHGPVAAGALNWGEPVLESALTAIRADGPAYRGRSAVALAESDIPFEAVAEWLWGGRDLDPTTVWSADHANAASLRERIGPVERPIERLIAAVPLLALDDSDRFATATAVELRRARDLIVRLARLAHAHESGGERSPAGRVSERLASALGTTHPDAGWAINRVLILCADHELNVSAFAARVVASAGSDLYACLTAALAALSGARHGGLSERIDALLTAAGHRDRPEDEARDRLRRGEAVPGFGHPLYPDGDPRFDPLWRVAETLAPGLPALARLQRIAEAMAEAGLGRPHLDFGLVAVARALGLASGSATVLFAMGRLAGWVAHVLEQRLEPGLLRPRARYRGPA